MKKLLNHPLLLELVTALAIILLMIMEFPTKLSYYLLGVLLVAYVARILGYYLHKKPKA